MIKLLGDIFMLINGYIFCGATYLKTYMGNTLALWTDTYHAPIAYIISGLVVGGMICCVLAGFVKEGKICKQ